MVATVRNRRGVISAVRPFDGPDGRLHLVDVEYNDGDTPLEQSLLWEREPGRRLLEATALPDVGGSVPMSSENLLAMVRACRWSSRLPYLDPDGSGPLHRLPVSSPFHGAVQVEDFQLVPLLKALRMPRVSLLIADDVGLGKTIEAGLILTELLLRRRIRRVLIATPAALRVQWRDELWEKFSLDFEIVDRDSTLRLRRQLGMDANPWRTHSRIITSYHYLKQADILEDFRTASRPEGDGARLPWDLLIVDEAHNLTPTPFGEESDLCSMLRQIAPFFEHRLFLTATPHNGHTRSFTGLLEMLDPVRFSQTDELRPAERARIEDVLVRRLKREINARTNPPRFCERLAPQARTLRLGPAEQALYAAFGGFRDTLRVLVQREARKRRLAGTFAVEILKKRLLSCPVAFADSWHRVRAGMDETTGVSDGEVLAAQRALDEETVDDREAASRGLAASAAVGAWLKPMAADLRAEIASIDAALATLGLSPPSPRTAAAINPAADARYDELRRLIDTRLRDRSAWRDDERLVVFTEYKTTLDYLLRRLRHDYDAERVLYLYGGMDESRVRGGSHGHELTREEVKADFNDVERPVRILVATDAASEGLNLQATARYVLHYDIPWNPARLEQRNGRLDRHGQARDVTVWYFVSDDEQDLKFLSDVVRKVDAIREDLGATGDVFDELTHCRLVEGESIAAVERDLDRRILAARLAIEVPRDDRISVADDPPPHGAAKPPAQTADKSPDARGGAAEDLTTASDAAALALAGLASELDFSPDALRTTLDSALGVQLGRPRLSEPDDHGRSRLLVPHPPAWAPVIDDTLRSAARSGAPGALRHLAFDPAALLEWIGERPVFRPRTDTALLHLGHPMIQRALTVLTRQRFPGSGADLSRWTVTQGDVPAGADALLLLTVEEIAVNELRETFHHWVRTLRVPIRHGVLADSLPHVPPAPHTIPEADISTATTAVDLARDLWNDVMPDIRALLQRLEAGLTGALAAQLGDDRERALREESERYQSRQGEVSALIESSTVKRLEREIAALRNKKEQGVIWDEARRLEEYENDIARIEEEVERRKRHYEEVRSELARERARILERLLPRRHALRGSAQVLPVAVEVILLAPRAHTAKAGPRRTTAGATPATSPLPRRPGSAR